MTDHAPLQTAGTSEASACAQAQPYGESWTRALVERQVARLDEMAERGLNIIRGLEREATTAPAPGQPPPDRARIIMDFTRVQRAVRMAFFLQSRLVAELHRLERQKAQDAVAAQARAQNDAADFATEQRRRKHVGNIVWRIASDKFEDDQSCGRLAREAVDRLEQDDIYGHVNSRPLSELIAELCQDLDLVPDWPELAKEGWAREEYATGRPGRPLAAVIDRPPRRAGGEPDRPGGSIETNVRSAGGREPAQAAAHRSSA